MAVARDAARIQGRSHIWIVFCSNAVDKGCYFVWLTVFQAIVEVDDAPVVQFELLKLAFQGGGPCDALFDIVSALDPSLFARSASWARTIALRSKSVDDLGRVFSTAWWFQGKHALWSFASGKAHTRN